MHGYYVGQTIKFISDHGQHLEGQITDLNNDAVLVVNPILGCMSINYSNITNPSNPISSARIAAVNVDCIEDVNGIDTCNIDSTGLDLSPVLRVGTKYVNLATGKEYFKGPDGNWIPLQCLTIICDNSVTQSFSVLENNQYINVGSKGAVFCFNRHVEHIISLKAAEINVVDTAGVIEHIQIVFDKNQGEWLNTPNKVPKLRLIGVPVAFSFK